jgi:LPXTG-motif cell wall-anchored protein
MIVFKDVKGSTTYDIYADDEDTGVDVVVQAENDATAVLDFYSVTEMYHDFDTLNTLKANAKAAVIKGKDYAPASTGNGGLADFSSSLLGGVSKSYGYYGYRLTDEENITIGSPDPDVSSYPDPTPIPPITNVTEPTRVTLYFATCDVTVETFPANGGSIETPVLGTGNYAYGSTVPLKVAETNGYEFKKWEQISGTVVAITNETSKEASFKVPYGAVSLRANLYEDGGTGAGANEKASIWANGFKLTKSEAATLTADTAKTKAIVAATNASGDDAYSAVTASALQLAVINSGEVGSYSLTFTNPVLPVLMATVTVKVYEDGENGEGANSKANIWANGFSLTETSAAALDIDTSKVKAELTATNVSGEDAYSNVAVDSAQLAAIKSGEAGKSYSLTFANPTSPELTATVTVKIYDDGGTGEGANEKASIWANGFKLTKSQAEELNENIAKLLAEVAATDASGADAYATVTADGAQLTAIKSGKAGRSYKLTFTNPVSPALTAIVTVRVYDDGGTGGKPGPGGEPTDPDDPNLLASIFANGFSITKADAGKLTANTAKAKAFVAATNATGENAYSAVAVDNAQLAAIKAGEIGKSYSLTFTNPTSPALTATVTVRIYEGGETGGKPGPGGEPTDPDDPNLLASIWANGFKLTEVQAAALTADLAKSNAALVATDASGEDTYASVTVDSAQLSAIKSGKSGKSYSLTFTNPVNPALTATITVAIEGKDPSGDDDEDELPNGEEEEHGTDPDNQDTDGDGFPDGWEVKYGYDPLDPSDPERDGDDDGDGVINWNEYLNGTNPKVADTFGIIEHFGEYSGSGTISAKVDHDYRKFVSLLYDGEVVDPSNYDISEGSTVITLHEAHARTYSVGRHDKFVAQYTDGRSEFIYMSVVAPAGAVAKTGDDVNLLLLIVLGLAAFLGLGLAMAARRRKRSRETRGN